MSAVAVLVAAVFWTWLWGIVGLLLATPLTVCLLVIGKHVPQLAFLAVLLGNEPVFEPKRRVYQRLLAGDLEEAAELVDDDLENRPLVEVYDTLLIPALALAETDWHHGELDDSRHAFILQSLKVMIHDTGDDLQKVPAKGDIEDGNPPRPCILCLPARDEADELLMMLAQLLATSECLVQSVSFTIAASELVALVERRKPDVVCISATPPAAVMHAPSVPPRSRPLPADAGGRGIVERGRRSEQGDMRIGGGAATHVVATLAEAQEQVCLLIQPRLQPPEKRTTTDSGPLVMEAAHQ